MDSKIDVAPATKSPKVIAETKFLLALKLEEQWKKLEVRWRGSIQTPHPQMAPLHPIPVFIEDFAASARSLAQSLETNLCRQMYGRHEVAAKLVAIDLMQLFQMVSGFGALSIHDQCDTMRFLRSKAPPGCGGQNIPLERNFNDVVGELVPNSTRQFNRLVLPVAPGKISPMWPNQRP